MFCLKQLYVKQGIVLSKVVVVKQGIVLSKVIVVKQGIVLSKVIVVKQGTFIIPSYYIYSYFDSCILVMKPIWNNICM